jgi:hypothetical protein
MLTAKTTILAELKLFRLGPLVFGGCVVSLFALGAGKRNDVSHKVLPLNVNTGGGFTHTGEQKYLFNN